MPLVANTVECQFCWSGKSAHQPRKNSCGESWPFLKRAVYAVLWTGSSSTVTPRFVFHWPCAHSARALFVAEDEKVYLSPVRPAFEAGLALSKSAFAAATSYFV